MDSSSPERNTTGDRRSIADFDFEKVESQESQEYSEVSSISVIDPQSSNNQSDFEDLEMSNVGDDTSNTFHSTINTTLTPSSSPIEQDSSIYKSFQGDSPIIPLEDSDLVHDQTLENVSDHEAVQDHEQVHDDDHVLEVRAQDHFLGHLLDNVLERVHEQNQVRERYHERVQVQDEVQDQVEPIQNLLQDPDLSIEDMIQDIRESDEDRTVSIPQNVQDLKPVQDQVRNHQEPSVRFVKTKREGDRIIIETTSPNSGKTQ